MAPSITIDLNPTPLKQAVMGGAGVVDIRPAAILKYVSIGSGGNGDSR